MLKKSLFFILYAACCMLHSFAQYDAQNISFLSNWFDSTVLSEPVYGIKYQGCWGYAANGKEYAIIGSTDGTHIIEITDPLNPVRRSYVKGRRDQCIWREYKTYQNYLYAVSDDDAPNSFQIIDLSYLPDSVHVVYDDITIFERSHTIYVDGNKLYCGSVTGISVNGYATMAVYELSNPETPQLLRTLDDDFPGLVGQVHDMFVRNDTVYASCGFSGLYIFNLESNNTFSLLGSITQYPDAGYNHSSFLTPDGKTLIFCDEVPVGLKVKLLDVSDLTDLKIQSVFQSNAGATPHNPYIVGDKAIIAYYEDGIQVYDISDPFNPLRTGYFDTHPQNGTTYNGYAGCWGAYTDLPSGNLIASDMQNGLFILDASLAVTGIKEKKAGNFNLFVAPNPFSNQIQLNFNLPNNESLSIELYDITGKMILSEKNNFRSGKNQKKINLPAGMAAGIYVLKIRGEKEFSVTKVIKTN